MSDFKNENQTIDILIADNRDSNEVSSILPAMANTFKTKQIPIETITQNLTDFLNALCKSLDNVSDDNSKYEVGELSVSIGINGSGKIFLIGEISAGINSSITLKLKKK